MGLTLSTPGLVCARLTVAGEAGVGGLGAPHCAAVEEGHRRVRQHRGVATRDQAALGRRACPLPRAVAQSDWCKVRIAASDWSNNADLVELPQRMYPGLQ